MRESTAVEGGGDAGTNVPPWISHRADTLAPRRSLLLDLASLVRAEEEKKKKKEIKELNIDTYLNRWGDIF